VLIIWWVLCIACCNLKFGTCLGALQCIWPVNTFGIKFGTLGWSNWGFLDENGLKTVRTISGNMNVRLSERTASCKRTCPDSYGHSTLKRAVSERQANKNQCYGIEFAQANLWSLKRNGLCSATFDFLFRNLYDLSELSKSFLLLV